MSELSISNQPPLAGTEVEALLGALDRMRGYLLWKCGGLEDAGETKMMDGRTGAQETARLLCRAGGGGWREAPKFCAMGLSGLPDNLAQCLSRSSGSALSITS